MRILVATDAWKPQVNGVVRTYERLAEEVKSLSASLSFLTPVDFPTVPCPTYPEIRLALPSPARAARLIAATGADAIHIATEGPVGWMARSYCRRRGIPFTTSFHTRFPEYLASRFAIPERLTYALQRRFHNAGAGIMVATPSLAADLARRGFERLMAWTRGVDTDALPAAHHPPLRRGTDIPLRRTRRNREEHRSISRARPAGRQGDRRQRTAASLF